MCSSSFVMQGRLTNDPLYCLDTSDLVPYWCKKPTKVNGTLVGEYNEGDKNSHLFQGGYVRII